MTNGLVAVKPGSVVGTPDATQVVIDTHQGGSMKIYKKHVYKLDATNVITFDTGGFTYGRIIVSHDLNYVPAILAYYYRSASKRGDVLPILTQGGGLMQAIATSSEITLDYLLINGVSPLAEATNGYVVLFIYAERLDG